MDGISSIRCIVIVADVVLASLFVYIQMNCWPKTTSRYFLIKRFCSSSKWSIINAGEFRAREQFHLYALRCSFPIEKERKEDSEWAQYDNWQNWKTHLPTDLECNRIELVSVCSMDLVADVLWLAFSFFVELCLRVRHSRCRCERTSKSTIEKLMERKYVESPGAQTIEWNFNLKFRFSH